MTANDKLKIYNIFSVYNMSGMPKLNPSDGAKFREQYLANLALQAKNDDENLQANKIFKKTGQTPSQPMDTRNTTEKLADIERLKIDLRASLAEIADGQQAQDIVNQLAGIGADALRFVAQHMPEIIKELKPKYKYGILSSVFIPYIMRYMEKYNQTRGVEFGLQESTGRDILLSNRQILQNIVRPEDITRLKDDILSYAESYLNPRSSEAFSQNLDDLEEVIFSEDDLRGVMEIPSPDLQMTIRRQIDESMRELPTKYEINELYRQFQIATTRNDIIRSQALLNQFIEMTTVAPEVLGGVQIIKAEIGPQRPPETSSALTVPGKARPSQKDIEEAVKTAYAYVSPDQKKEELASIWYEDLNPETRTSSRTLLSAGYLKFVQTLDELKILENPFKSKRGGKPTKKQLVDFLEDPKTMAILDDAFRGDGGGKMLSMGPGMTMGKSPPTTGQIGASEGKGIKGKGLLKTKADNFIEFGKLLINPAKLDENIIAIRRPTGRNTPEFPTERVSKHLGKVIRHISGGGVPVFEDLAKLDEKEKRYLHKLMKSSSLLDRISVPTPNKDEDEKDTHRFEVLKGEIMSGNDSHQLIKELKVLILKLVSKDLLPKSQAREILFDLVSLGF